MSMTDFASVTNWLPRDEPGRLSRDMVKIVMPKRPYVGRFLARQLLNAGEDIDRVQGPAGCTPPLAEILTRTLDRPSAAEFMQVVDGILDLISDGSFATIDALFSAVRVEQTSTDYLVALLRLTFPVREKLCAWGALLMSVQKELQAREGVNATLELTGLNADLAAE